MIIKSSKPISAFDFYHHYEFQRELIWNLGLPSCFSGKESTCNAGDVVLIPRLGRSPGEGNGNPHEYSCLANPMDRGVWQATIHGVKKELDMTSWLNNSNNNLDSQFSSVAQSCTILCHPKDWSTPLPCPSPNPRACSNSCLSSQWCHPNHLILSSLLLLPSVFPSIRVFSNESILHNRWPKYWSFRFSISSSNENSGLISFRIDCLDLLAVQGTLKCLLPTPQFNSMNSSVLSFLYSPTLTSIHDYWKKHSLTRRTFVGKVMSLLLNMLSRLVKAFLPRSKHLSILWLQPPSALILEPKKIKSLTVSIAPHLFAMIWWNRMLWY